MNKSELQAKIAKMEKGLANPNIQGDTRKALQLSLGKARKQLATLEKSESKKLTTKAKPKAAIKSPPTAKPRSGTATYSWRKKTDVGLLSPVQIKCRHYHFRVEKPTKVSLKRSGKSSMVVTAQAGDHIIFDEQGYAVYIMEAASFARKCATTPSPTRPTKKQVSTHSTHSKAVSKPRKASTNNKKATRSKPSSSQSTSKKKPSSKQNDSSYMKTIQAFNREVEKIRKAYQQPEANQVKVKQDLKSLAAKAGQKNYLAFVERKIKRLQKDEVQATKAEIVRLGIALRPMIQTLRGALQDVASENRKVLEPTYENLIRWSKSPGQFDLAGVDAAPDRKATTKAKVGAREEKGFLEWLFG